MTRSSGLVLVAVGLGVVLVGLLVWRGALSWFGRLPGDIRVERDNVRFYATPAEAERDGLRACLRCRPQLAMVGDPLRERMLALCRYIETHAAESLTLVRRGYEAGEFAYLLLLSSQRTYFQTNLQYLDSLRELRASAVEIDGLLLRDSLMSRN